MVQKIHESIPILISLTGKPLTQISRTGSVNTETTHPHHYHKGFHLNGVTLQGRNMGAVSTSVYWPWHVSSRCGRRAVVGGGPESEWLHATATTWQRSSFHTVTTIATSNIPLSRGIFTFSELFLGARASRSH